MAAREGDVLPGYVIDNINRRMATLNLTQAELARQSKVRAPAISRLLARQAGVTFASLERIAQALKCSLVDLFLRSSEAESYETLISEFQNAQARLSQAAERLASWAAKQKTS